MTAKTTGKTAAKLDEKEIADAIAALPGWHYEGNALLRHLVFRDFREAVAFLTLIAFDAEEADHHPDVTLSYKHLRISLSTHSDGGVTAKDLALARVISGHHDGRRWGK